MATSMADMTRLMDRHGFKFMNPQKEKNLAKTIQVHKLFFIFQAQQPEQFLAWLASCPRHQDTLNAFYHSIAGVTPHDLPHCETNPVAYFMQKLAEKVVEISRMRHQMPEFVLKVIFRQFPRTMGHLNLALQNDAFKDLTRDAGNYFNKLLENQAAALQLRKV